MGELDDLLKGPNSSGDSEPADELTIATVLMHYGQGDVRIPSGFGWKSMRCPFKQYHNDGRASASVNRTKNKFRCHACGTAGDPIDIIRKLEGMNYREACEQARAIFGTSVSTVSRTVPRSTKRRPMGSERWKDILD